MSALAIIPTGAEYQTLATHAKNLVDSGFLPSSIRTPQQAIAIITLGAELKIGPWQAINGINVIQGKPTVSPQLMLALINASGELEDMKIDGDAKSCTVTMKRRNRTPHTETFTMQDANAQGLTGKSNWNKMPAVMLKWRAVAAAARIVFPDIIIGMYTPEEVDPAITVNSEGELVGDIVITREPEQKQTTVQHVVDGSTARVVEADADEDEQPEPVKPDLSMQKAVTITTVKVCEDQNGKTFYGLTTAGDDKISVWTRRQFIESGWIGEHDWQAQNETYGPYNIPAAIAKDDKGYWKIVHVTSAPDRETQREPKDVLGQGGNKGPVGREPITIDNINDVDPAAAEDVPANLPETGKLPTAFSQPAKPAPKPNDDFVEVSGFTIVKRGSGAAVVFTHKDMDKVELSIAASKFNALVADLTHGEGYQNTFKLMEPDGKSCTFTKHGFPHLMLKTKSDDNGDTVQVVSAFESGSMDF